MNDSQGLIWIIAILIVVALVVWLFIGRGPR